MLKTLAQKYQKATFQASRLMYLHDNPCGVMVVVHVEFVVVIRFTTTQRNINDLASTILKSQIDKAKLVCRRILTHGLPISVLCFAADNPCQLQSQSTKHYIMPGSGL